MAGYLVLMKTNSAASRFGNLRLTLACLAVVALASFDLWTGGYCYRNRAKACMQQTGTSVVPHWSPTRSVMCPSF